MSRPSTTLDSVSYQELEQLMQEFPDWKDQYPDLYKELHPPRYPKNKSGPAPQNQTGQLQLPHKRARTVPFSDYQQTYKRHNTRPRSTKKPPPDAPVYNGAPMSFNTNQRSDYTPKDFSGRGELIKKDDQYEPPEAHFDGTTNYSVDYMKRDAPLEVHRDFPSITHQSMPRRAGKFDGMTTTKEHYKKWKPQPQFAFGDLPVFTGSLLYPDRSRYLETTNQDVYKGTKGAKPQMIKMKEGNIKIEGEADFSTVNRDTYNWYEGAMPAERVKQKEQMYTNSRAKFTANTQSQRDFPGYNGKMPAPRKPVPPPPSTIEISFNRSQQFETEQRKQYQGVDVIAHPVPESCKKETNEYIPPSVPVETVTSNKQFYKPIDVEKYYTGPVVPPSQRKERKPLPKLDGRTTNKEFYKKWDVQPPQKMGDYYEANMFVRRDMYVPPAEKFTHVSTTKDNFPPKRIDIPERFVPSENIVVKEGSHNFVSMYNTNYNEPGVVKNLDKKQAARLLKDLKKRKMAEQRFSNVKFAPQSLQAV